MKIETEKQKQKSAQDTNATKHDEDDTTSRGSAGGRSQGARKCKAIAEANAENAKVEKERDKLTEALNILEAHLQRTGVVKNRPYSECPPYHLILRQRWGPHHLIPPFFFSFFLWAWWGMYMP